MKRVQDKRYAASIKPLAVLTLSLILTLIMCLPAFAAVSKAQAMKTAKKMVPASCRCTEAEHEKDDREWEFEYLSKDRKTKYEVHVDDTTGKVTELEMEKVNKGCACSYRISAAKANKAVLKIMKGAKITGTRKKRSGCRCTYRISFKSKWYTGYAVVNARTGKVIRWEKHY